MLCAFGCNLEVHARLNSSYHHERGATAASMGTWWQIGMHGKTRKVKLS